MTRPAPKRPRVLVAITVSVDGRVTTSRQERLLDQAVSARCQSVWPSDTDELTLRRRQWIETTWAPTIVLEGSGTFVADDVESRWVDAEVDVIPEDLFEDFIPAPSPRWFAVVDGRGRVDWQFTGDGDTALLEAQVVVSEGGGGINGALLRAGLVDEVHVITFPALVSARPPPSTGPPCSRGMCRSP